MKIRRVFLFSLSQKYVDPSGRVTVETVTGVGLHSDTRKAFDTGVAK